MTPVYQTVIDQGSGDCERAAIASLLDLPLSEVPNFREGLNPGDATPSIREEWLRGRGLKKLRVPVEGTEGYLCEAGDNGPIYCLGTVPSQMFENTTHSVVCRINGFDNGVWIEVVHDPNPNNRPYRYAEIQVLTFFISTRFEANEQRN
ncbi:MAG: hypothetical protein HUJ26_12645 [Planctomycetaceae bacterium]|nr:hypothetical protein [Planctomycetaceae bacterium]